MARRRRPHAMLVLLALAAPAALSCRFDPSGLATAGDGGPALGQPDARGGAPGGDGDSGSPGTADAGPPGPADAAVPDAPDAAVPEAPVDAAAPDAPDAGPTCGANGQDCCAQAPVCDSGLICVLGTCTL